MTRRVLIALSALFLVALPILADEIVLTTGKTIRGTITAEHSDRVEIKLATGETRTIARSEIVILKKGTSPLEAYRQKRADLDEKDLGAILDLATWCRENRLRRQGSGLLKLALEIDGDCPEVRRGLNQKWNGTKWVRDPAKGKVGAPKPGDAVDAAVVRLAIEAPTGWKATVDKEGVRVFGPSRYRTPVVLEILETTKAATAGFPEAAGWSKPEAIAYGKLAGRWSRRVEGKAGHRLCVRETALSVGGVAVVVRLTALVSEIDDWLPHVARMLEDAKVVAPKLDYVNAKLKVGFRHPKEWTVTQDKWDDGTLYLNVSYKGDAGPLDWAWVMYVWLRPDEVDGAQPGDKPERLIELALKEYADGDVVVKRDVKLGPVPAKLWEVNELDDGMPVRFSYVVTVHAGRVHLCYLKCRERAIDRFRPLHELIYQSFVFDPK